ncbi:MAG: type II toxin-antitoxin system YoeB family toxin [Lachnospiraceae bacterium]|nr:type II toxin-antitoxin system YoeB family toxin [Lachnospiraceae bacterium]
MEDTQRNGTGGLGHSEPLKENLSGWWSKKLDEGNRMVFRVTENTVEIAECYTHYGDK